MSDDASQPGDELDRGAGPDEADTRRGPEGNDGRWRHPLARSGFIEYDRVLFFTDAVFAIAITLLAVDLRVPAHASETPVTIELSNASRGLISFGISFVVIALFWLGHHGNFRYIKSIDRPLIGLNMLFLGTIAFLPYPTSLLAAAKVQQGGAVVFYSICIGAAGLCELAIWLYATRPGSQLADSSAEPVRLLYSLRIARVPIVFALSIPIALVAPSIAQYFWILILVSGLVINRLVPRPEPPETIGEQIAG